MKKRVLISFLVFVLALVALFFVVLYLSTDSSNVLLSAESEEDSSEINKNLETNQDLQELRSIDNPLLGRMNPENFNSGEMDEDKIPDRVPNQYLIQFIQSAGNEDIDGFYQENGIEEIKRVVDREDVNTVLVNIEDESDVEDIRRNSLVEIIEPNFIATTSARARPIPKFPLPNDPYLNNQWGITQTNLIDAWITTN